jgi:hypothetical protein
MWFGKYVRYDDRPGRVLFRRDQRCDRYVGFSRPFRLELAGGRVLDSLPPLERWQGGFGTSCPAAFRAQ